MNGMDGAKRVVGLPPAPLKRGTLSLRGTKQSEGVPEGRGSQKTPVGKILNP